MEDYQFWADYVLRKYPTRFSVKDILWLKKDLLEHWWGLTPRRSLPGRPDPFPIISGYSDAVENKLVFRSAEEKAAYVNALGYSYELFDDALARNDHETLWNAAYYTINLYERTGDYPRAYKTVIRVLKQFESMRREFPRGLVLKEREILEYNPPVIAYPYERSNREPEGWTE